MSLLYDVREECQEKCDAEETYVHAVHIGIRGDYHFVVSQSLYPVLDVECGLKEVEFVVFIDYFLCQTITVERLSAQ